MVYVPYDNDFLVNKASHLCYQYGRPLLKLCCILGCEYQFGLQKNKENSNSWSFFVDRMMYTDISTKI